MRKENPFIPITAIATLAATISIFASSNGESSNQNAREPQPTSTSGTIPTLLGKTPTQGIRIDYPTTNKNEAKKTTPQPDSSTGQTIAIENHNLFEVSYANPPFYSPNPTGDINQFGEKIVSEIKTHVEAQHSSKAIIAYKNLESSMSLEEYAQARLKEFKKISWFDAEMLGSRIVSGQKANIIHYTYKEHNLKTEVFHVIFFTNNQAWSIEFSYTMPTKNSYPDYAKNRLDNFSQMLDSMVVAEK